MPYNEIAGSGTRNRSADEPFGRFVFHDSLPVALRSLDDVELRTLLIALLQEWRDRAELAEGPV